VIPTHGSPSGQPAIVLFFTSFLSLVSTGLGVGWVLGTARWRCPETVAILRLVDLNMPVALTLVWRKDNTSPLRANFIGELRRLPGVRAVNKG